MLLRHRRINRQRRRRRILIMPVQFRDVRVDDAHDGGPRRRYYHGFWEVY